MRILWGSILLVLCSCTGTEVSTDTAQNQNINEPTCEFEELVQCSKKVVLGLCGNEIVTSRAATCEDCPEGDACEELEE